MNADARYHQSIIEQMQKNVERLKNDISMLENNLESRIQSLRSFEIVEQITHPFFSLAS